MSKNKKTSTINWIEVAVQKPEDGAYVLGEFIYYKKGDLLAFAMHYFEEGEQQGYFQDADEVRRSEHTKEKMIYWAAIPKPLYCTHPKNP